MRFRLVVLLLVAVAVGALLLAGSGPQPVAAATAGKAPASGACKFPTVPTGTLTEKQVAEIAWKLFVAANCPSPTSTNPERLVWEHWIEQLVLYPASGKARGQEPKPKRLHGSSLALALAKTTGTTTQQTVSPCTPMASKYKPTNVESGAVLCEEVRLNPIAEKYIKGQGYQVRTGQEKAAQAGTTIQFTDGAIEVKVEWIPANDFTSPPFSCPTTTGLHVETIDGQCYAMIGMHINLKSKLLPQTWLWATFEPNNPNTNPQRCQLYGPCVDPWGTTSTGGHSSALQALMAKAHLAPEFSNYFMDGVQIDYTNNLSTQLSNTIIEGEAVGTPAGQASCITCHSQSAINSAGTDASITLATGNPPTPHPPAGYILRDFVWSLNQACPGSSARASTSPCTSTTSKTTPSKTTPQ